MGFLARCQGQLGALMDDGSQGGLRLFRWRVTLEFINIVQAWWEALLPLLLNSFPGAG